MNKNSKILVLGATGMVGSAIVRELNKQGYKNILTPSRKMLDLRTDSMVLEYFNRFKPDYIFLASAKVGGIKVNNERPADFIYQHTVIQSNVINNAHTFNVKKLLFLGSSCIYPKKSPQPIKEEYLLTGELEPTNEPYAIAKINGIKMCEAYRKQYGCNFISVMPTNLYGEGDNYDLETSHVLPALLRKFHEAKTKEKDTVEIWGDGSPYREFLHVDDLAEACLFLMNNYNDGEIINIGTGKDISIHQLALLISEITEYKGEIVFNDEYPNGTHRKLLDVSKIHSLGWRHSIELEEGIRKVYEQVKNNF